MATTIEKHGLKVSKYHIASQLPNGSTRLFSTLWGSIVDLDPRHARLLFGEVDAISETETIDLASLREIGLLVASDCNEFDLLTQQIESWKSVPMLRLTYCPTYACNMLCGYCIQQTDHPVPSSSEHASPTEVASFARRALEFSGLDRLEVTLFGGEPLLAPDKLVDFMIGVNTVAASLAGGPPSYQLVTNGSLLTSSHMRTLHELGLDRIQFTLDGLPATHQMRRRLPDGRQTWSTIVANCLVAAELGVKNSINMVVDLENHQEIPQLIDALDSMASRVPELRKNSEFVFSLLIPTHQSAGRSAALLDGHEQRLLQSILHGYVHARDRGWSTANWFFCRTSSRESRHSFIVGPDGSVFKCYGAIGDTRYAIGSISDNIKDIYARSEEVVGLDLFDADCQDCPILPLCRGGCQAISALQHGGEYGHKLCERGVWLPVFQEAIAHGYF